MMKKILLLFLMVATAFTLEAQIETPAPSPASKLKQTVGLTDVMVEYSRPSMKGRKIFGGLVPYDQVWRTGANARTKITFKDDITINGDTLKSGTYAIFTKPTAENWKVFFYTDHAGGGVPRDWSEAKIALTAIVPVQKMPMPIQSFTITFDDLTDDGATLGMLWEDVYVGVPFKVPTDTKAAASISKVMAGPSANDYYSAAGYYRRTGRDLNQALTWVDKALKINSNAWWMKREKALILAGLGKKKEAIAAATESMKGAQEAGNANFVEMNKKSIAEWSSK